MLHSAQATTQQKNKRRAALHEESLLRIPLVAQLYTDPQNTLSARSIDQNWFYQKAIPHPMPGFNPYHSRVFYPAKSCFAEWLKHPQASARETNVDDRLLREVLFSTHDYLHGWAVRAIRELMPNLGFGSAPITKKNIEDMVFCHLLTEAAAVVGLDYWYLATIDLNRICPIGTMINSLTVTYHENDLAEYRRFHSNLEVQRPDFFEKIAVFYCTGEFEGFDLADLKRSPKLMKWISHELRYGACQREYTRQWFSHLSKNEISHSREALQSELSCDKKWRKQLMRDLGTMLWEKVKQDKLHSYPAIKVGTTWAAPEYKRQDFRFLNLNAVKNIQDSPNEFPILFYQWLSQHDFESLDPELFPFFEDLLRRRDFHAVKTLLRDLRPLTIGAEPKDLFFLP